MQPDEYKKPIRLDPSWTNDTSTAENSTGKGKKTWASKEEWDKTKRGYEWLFPHIDNNKDGKISTDEYQAFQDHAGTARPTRRRIPIHASSTMEVATAAHQNLGRFDAHPA